MPTISVVIPVYKVGKYIENSMKSVCYQTFKDFEVVLVDNNTPDDSIEIAEKVLQEGGIEYRVVKQTIQGLPAARNMGIREARGEWIISIDPDDTVSKFFLQELYNCAIEERVDIVFSKYDEVGTANLFFFPEEMMKNVVEIYEKDAILNNLLVRKMPLMVSNMFFRKSFFVSHGFKFDQNVILGADLLLLWRILMETPKVAFINKYLYNHYQREDSLMTAPAQNKVDSNLAGYRRQLDVFEELSNRQFANWIYAREVYAILRTLCVFGNRKLFLKNKKDYYTKEVYKSLKSFPDRIVSSMNFCAYFMPSFFYYLNHTFLKNPIVGLVVRKVRNKFVG